MSLYVGRADLTDGQRRTHLENCWLEARYRSYGRDAESFIRWCRELYYVRSKDRAGGRTLFDLYDFQEELARSYVDGDRYQVVLKSRQLGATTLGMALCLWKMLYRPGGATVLILSKTQVDARAALAQVNHALSFFPDWYAAMMPDIEAQSNDRLVLRFPDGTSSTAEAMVATERSGASRTADLVICDEVALWPKPEETMRSLAPTTDAAALAPGQGAVLICFSTARGATNYFATLWKDAYAGRNRYKSHFVPWTVNPLSNPKAHLGEIDTSLIDARRAEFADQPHLFYAEYPASPEEAFMSSGHSRFANLPPETDCKPFLCRGGLLGANQYTEFVDAEDGLLYLSYDPAVEQPQLQGDIVIGADPAMGVGRDSSVFYVMQRNSAGIRVLGYWASNTTEPLDFADVLYSAGFYFGTVMKPALLAVEMNPSSGGGGTAVLGRLRERGYTNLYRYVQPAHKGRRALSYYGLPITRVTKPMIVDTLAEWLTPDELSGDLPLWPLPPILRDELGTFVVKSNGTVSADGGAHDDHVLAAAITTYALVTNTKEPAAKRVEVEAPASNTHELTIDLAGMRKDIDRQMQARKRIESRQARIAQRRLAGGRRR